MQGIKEIPTSFTQFAHSGTGEKIRPILHDGETIRQMEALSAAGRPALLAVADKIEKVAPSLSDTEKQHVGRWVHRLLGPRGWRPVEKKRMPRGSLFATASVYRRIAGVPNRDGPSRVLQPAPPADAESRLRLARQRIRRLPVKPQGSRAFIAEKRQAAKRER
jgi:hypothetical protein